MAPVWLARLVWLQCGWWGWWGWWGCNRFGGVGAFLNENNVFLM